MSNQLPNINLTEKFLQVHVPEFFAVSDTSNLGEAYKDYISHVEEVAGPREDNLSVFSWDDVDSIGNDILPATSNCEAKRRKNASKAGSLTLGIGHSLAKYCLEKDPMSITTTGNGALILVDGQGYVKTGINAPNNEVDSSYGDVTPYVLEKLGWAKLVEVMTHQGADWGQGYDTLTEYLRSIGRIGKTALPHVGMATAHETLFDETKIGQDRNALAYASASNYTLTSESIGNLLKDPRFFELYGVDQNKGLFTNISDWMAGRLDSLVARRANELYLGRRVSTSFPYLDEPDYINVDNN